MIRYFSCLAAALLVGASLQAGELDAEFGPKSAVASATPHKVVTVAKSTTTVADHSKADAWKASELDGETPSQCWGCGWRGCGWGGCGNGWGGYGYSGCGYGGCGWGGYCYSGCGWGGYGGYGYSSYGYGGYGYTLGSYGWGGAFYPSYVSYSYYGYPVCGLYY